MAVLSNSKKMNTKYWIVFAVEPFKKRCDNFDAEFITLLSNSSKRGWLSSAKIFVAFFRTSPLYVVCMIASLLISYVYIWDFSAWISRRNSFLILWCPTTNVVLVIVLVRLGLKSRSLSSVDSATNVLTCLQRPIESRFNLGSGDIYISTILALYSTIETQHIFICFDATQYSHSSSSWSWNLFI